MSRSDPIPSKVSERQVAALPLRLGLDGSLDVLLVTSRETRRWVLPKGNLMKGLSLADAAATEAEEEAGVRGRVVAEPYRRFDYWKRRPDAFHLCHVDVFLLVVTEELDDWKERAERQREWVSPARAFEMVLEPGLQSIFRELEKDEAVRDLARPKRERAGQRRWRAVARAVCAPA
ncbi:NUDIX hydrolase [Aureimonas mangrovi]|uniref:NUDIX hydrolase n=1 Tax=Aureimonas mangrovi TaxID=2758041 RepID=UPI00163D3F68|nr:NUDIX hydrolase [Aureimonas mangrovi]